jgi:hypothetical protein
MTLNLNNTVFEGKFQNLIEQLNTQKAENLIMKEERDDLKAGYMEDLDKYKEDLNKRNRNIENLR